MVNLERERLLSELEFDRLKKRADEPLTRATNDGRVRRKLSAWLKNMNDVFFILQKLPKDQLKEVVQKDDIDKLSSIIREATGIIDYYPTGLEQWRQNLEKTETEMFKLQYGSFLKKDIQGISSFSKPLIELVQNGKTWTEEDLLKELHIDPKDGDAIRITTRQLEELERFDLVKRGANGWMWAERKITRPKSD
jgi:hypothetical protein